MGEMSCEKMTNTAGTSQVGSTVKALVSRQFSFRCAPFENRNQRGRGMCSIEFAAGGIYKVKKKLDSL